MLYVVGIGPGACDLVTDRAKTRIAHADVIMGNERYLGLISELIPEGVEVISGHMGTEVERAKKAVELGRHKEVVLVSGGDPGIYGMAGLVIEVLESTGAGTELEIIPGITAASAVAALLGAPLSNDFAVVSLSDLLVPWHEIETRLNVLAGVDIVVVLYNPRSKSRKVQLEKAYEIFTRFRSGNTVVGIVREAERAGSEVIVTTLRELPEFYHIIDMSTTVVIGSSKTEKLGKWMVTRRGYERKYDYGVKRQVTEEYVKEGEKIWKKGRAIVAEIVSNYSGKFTEYERRIAERVVFATADPSFLDCIAFTHNAVETGVKCIREGRSIITDIEMVKMGINSRYRAKVQCFVNEPGARDLAVKRGITRTAAGIRLAREFVRDGIVVVGNSPSACIELIELMNEGVKPALIIATPVGFVNAAEVKEMILDRDVPCIAIKGPRGGTPSAVAIINEIIELAEDDKGATER